MMEMVQRHTEAEDLDAPMLLGLMTLHLFPDCQRIEERREIHDRVQRLQLCKMNERPGIQNSFIHFREVPILRPLG